MKSRVIQHAKARAGAKVKITSNYPNKKLALRIPRGMKVRIRQV